MDYAMNWNDPRFRELLSRALRAIDGARMQVVKATSEQEKIFDFSFVTVEFYFRWSLT